MKKINKKINKRINILVTIVIVIIILPLIASLLFTASNKKQANVLEGIKGTAKVGDIFISYKSFGKGSPLIMIMGYGSTMNLWEDKLIDTLSKDFRVIIFDNRGMGDTTAGNKEFTIEQFADDTYGLMKALNIEKVNILGWSMGSYIAQELTLKYPDAVEKLVLYASTCNPEIYPSSPATLKILQDTSGTSEEQGTRWISLLFPKVWLENNSERIKEIFYKPLGNINPENIGKQGMAIDKWKGTCDRLYNIKSKTLVIDGSEDLLVPPENSGYIAANIKNSKLTLVDSAGHGLMFQDPDQFCKIIIEFLK
jgi:pimeloyl-ACP methyl ester carboxylesterase